MNILFLTLSQIISDINSRGIYPDLLRKFLKEGHNVFVLCPLERRLSKQTHMSTDKNLHILSVKTLNITKSNFLEKGFGTILIDYQYRKALQKHLAGFHPELVIYSTPPITFNRVIRFIRNKFNARSYLLLKDIFPQNAVDLGMFSKRSLFYWYFRKKEQSLYNLSDHIGCMSQANVDYILKHNPGISRKIIEVCPNSIELRHDMQIDQKAVRLKYGLPERGKFFIFGGNIGKPQGIDFILEVLKSNANRSDVYFIIAGSGTEYSKLDSFYKDQKLNNFLLLPALPREEFDQMVKLSYAGLIFLDKRYTIPNYPSRLLTYLEYKKPVLAATDSCTDIGKIAEENGYGLSVESGDIDSFNSKLNFMIKDEEGAKEMGEKGYRFLVDNYSVDVTYKIIMSHHIY